MYKIWIITLALNIIFTQIPATEYPSRIKQEDTIRTISHYREVNSRDEGQLVELIEEIMQDFLIPAISISVVKDQSIVWE